MLEKFGELVFVDVGHHDENYIQPNVMLTYLAPYVVLRKSFWGPLFLCLGFQSDARQGFLGLIRRLCELSDRKPLPENLT